MGICGGVGTGRRFLLPVIASFACLMASAGPANADVRAFRTSDGSEDAAFVKLGAATRVDGVVPDGAHGAYLIGNLLANGGQRQIVHVLPNGIVDPEFRPRIRGGHVLRAAVRGRMLAIAGTFASIGGQARTGLAVLDARTGRPRAWTPTVPRHVPSRTWGGIVFSGPRLIASAQHHVYGWREGETRPAWEKLLYVGQLPAALAVWRGSVMMLAVDPAVGVPSLRRLDPATGESRETGIDASHVYAMQNVGGRLLTIVQGVVVAIGDEAMSRNLMWCGRTPDTNSYVNALAGDTRTLYAGVAPISLDNPGAVPGVTACPFTPGPIRFAAPEYPYGAHGPLVNALALVGNHVLVFTEGF